MISQGANAVKSGQHLETELAVIMQGNELTLETQVKFTDCYNNPRSKMDFYIPELDLAIECKRQMGSGTADQKLPFVVENFKKFPSKYSLLVLDGDHYKNRTGIHSYLNSQVSEYFNWCFIEDFSRVIDEQTKNRAAT